MVAAIEGMAFLRNGCRRWIGRSGFSLGLALDRVLGRLWIWDGGPGWVRHHWSGFQLLLPSLGPAQRVRSNAARRVPASLEHPPVFYSVIIVVRQWADIEHPNKDFRNYRVALLTTG